MTSSSETSAAALERLRADVEGVAQVLAVGRSALPRLAMGTDDEGLVHVGMDQRGDVVRLDLDRHWRDTLPAAGLGAAVTGALQQAAQVRTGDWAAAIAASHPGPRRTAATPAAQPRARSAPGSGGPVSVMRTSQGPVVTIDPDWAAGADDAGLRSGLLSAFSAPQAVAPPASGSRPHEVGVLARDTRDELLASTETLPGFMRSPIQGAVERVHDDIAAVLSLSFASEGLAAGELGTFASRLRDCLGQLDRPAGLPEASQAWAESAAGLAAGLAAARRSPRPLLTRLRRRASA